MSIVGCDIRLNDTPGVEIGNDTLISNTTSVTKQVVVDASLDDKAGVVGNDKSGLRIENSHVEARLAGVDLKSDCTDVRISNSILNGSHYGFRSECGDDIVLTSRVISGDSDRGQVTEINPPEYYGVYISEGGSCTIGEVRFVNCEVSGVSRERDHDGVGVYVEDAPAD